MKHFRRLLTVLCLAVPAVAAAEPLPQPVKDMDCLVGSWKGEGSLVMGKDKAKDSVTNARETHDHVARLPAGNALQFVYTGTQDGKAFRDVIDPEISRDEKSLSGRSETFVGGVSTSVMKLKAQK